MNELEIKRHSFDVAKNRLKEFSEKKESELVIRSVETRGGLLGLGNHKVTGRELNERLESIQGHLIDLNTTNNKTIKEFREVYNALDALDKDYITIIVANVKAIEKTSNDVREQQKTLKQHNEKLATQQNKLDTHQTEIDKNIENMKKIITTLKNFKEKLDGFQHLSDIDKIWSDCKTMRNDVQVVSDSIVALAKKSKNDIETANTKNKALLNQVNKEIIDLQKKAKTYMDFFSDLSKKVDSTASLLDKQVPVIQDTVGFVSQMKELSHLNDVDFIWEDVNKAIVDINNLENELLTVKSTFQEIQEHIIKIESFIDVLNGYEHLKDIDQIWNDLDDAKTNIVDLFKLSDDCNKQLQTYQTTVDSLKVENKKQDEKINGLSEGLTEMNDFSQANRNLIEELQFFRNSIDTIEHVSDIDFMWVQGNMLKENLEDANSSILSLKDKTSEMDKDITDKSKETSEKIAILETKLKYAYYVAGGALGLAVIELILALTGVI